MRMVGLSNPQSRFDKIFNIYMGKRYTLTK